MSLKKTGTAVLLMMASSLLFAETAKGAAEKAAAKDKELTVLSGIEFRSEYGSKSVHFIGYFPEKFENTELTASVQEYIVSCCREFIEKLC